MVQEYAKKQPEGFVNSIRKVAIVGVSASLSIHAIPCLYTTLTFHIHRQPGTSVKP